MKPLNVKVSKPITSSFKYKHIDLPALEFNWHYHPEYELMLMYGSSGKRFIGDSIAYYEENALFFLGPNLPHSWYAPPNGNDPEHRHRAILVQFKGNMEGLNFLGLPEFSCLQQLFQQAARGLQFRGPMQYEAGRILRIMEHQQGLDRLIALLNLLRMLSKASSSDYTMLSSVEFNRDFQPDEKSRIDRVCRFINRNYRERIRLEDAAEIANMSTTAFSRFFKRSTYKTFVNYVNDLRIERACKMLLESDLSVGEICYAVGFNNLSNFNRRFYERHGLSPRNYRQDFNRQIEPMSAAAGS